MIIGAHFDIVPWMLSPDQSRSERHARGTHLLDEVTALLRGTARLSSTDSLRSTGSAPEFAPPPIEDVVATLREVTPPHQLGFVNAISNSVDFLLKRTSRIVATSHKLSPPQPLPPGVVLPPPEIRLRNEEDIRQLTHTCEQLEYALDLANRLGKEDFTCRALAQMKHDESAPRLLLKIYALVGIASEIYPELKELPCLDRWSHRVNQSLATLPIPNSIHTDLEKRLRRLSGNEILHCSIPNHCTTHIENLVQGARIAFPKLGIVLEEPVAGASDAVIATTTNHQRASDKRTKLLIVPRYSGASITFNQIDGVNMLVSGIIALALEQYALNARDRILKECRTLSPGLSGSSESLATSQLPPLSTARGTTPEGELLGNSEDQHWLVAAALFSRERSFWGGFILGTANRVLKRLGVE